MVYVLCTISFIDGTQLKLEWTRPKEQDPRLSEMIEKVLANKSFAVEIEGRLVIIPVHNIKTIEVSPSPDNLPVMVVSGAKMVL